jgi:F0F1-type ATP synthase delta subunit
VNEGSSEALVPKPFVLSPRLIGRPHIARVSRELEAVDTYMASQAIRNPKTPPVVPGVSRVLRELVEANDIALEDQAQRQQLIRKLKTIKDTAPVAHVTFAVEPDITILTDIARWMRDNTHEWALLSVGVQPNIIGGCVMRTPDKVYDVSFKKFFANKQADLQQVIKGIVAT